MDLHMLIVGGLAALAVGGVIQVFLYPYLSGEIKAEKRQAAWRVPVGRKLTESQVDAANRRKQIVESLKEVEAKGKRKKQSIETRIAQAGLSWSRNQFIGFAAASAFAYAGLLLLFGAHPLIALGSLVVGGFGFPLWLLNFLRQRRLNKFTEEFPNAIDIIVRGVKAGLPLGDCLRVIASESAEPVRGEFRQIIEAQALGLSTGEAVDRIVERVPIPEASFFSIAINIQQKAGGNLAETLGNLSSVLRDRKKMKSKAKAMAGEAKASAYIIGSLPFVVGVLVWLTSPKYIELLWTTQTGQIVIGACGVWMGIGILVMKKMINFDI